MTSKAARHIEHRENSVRERIQSKLLTIKQVADKINPSDIFTKEMRDGTHFRHLCDSFMSRLSDFVNASLLAVHHVRQMAYSNTLLQLMLYSRRTLFPTFLLLLLLPSVDLFRLFLTSPVLADNSCGVFTDLFPRVSYSIGFCWRFGVLFLFARFWFFT